jgi:DNA-directed RNA polymerase specialized sigma24 family protein
VRLRALPSYDAAIGSFWTWLFHIAHNSVITHMRKRRRVVPECDDALLQRRERVAWEERDPMKELARGLAKLAGSMAAG